MLSEQEKKEMLEDAKNKHRKESFRSEKIRQGNTTSMDEYISFLDSTQKIFSPFKVLSRPTRTILNKL